jgi:hypothetical protein
MNVTGWLWRLIGIGLLVPAVASSQATAASLLGKMENVTVYPLATLRTSDETYAQTGHGIEFTFFIGERTRPMTGTERAVRCLTINNALREKGKPATCKDTNTEDTTRVLSQLTAGSRTDSVFTVTISKLIVPLVQFELAVASHTTPLRHSDAANNWELSGRIVEFPVLTLYGTIRPDWPVSPYVGLRFILAELKNARISQADSVATVEEDATGIGAALGAVFEPVGGFNLFAELSYSDIRFRTPQWKTPVNLRPIAGSFPKRLELTGLRVSAGVQLALGVK